MMSLPKYVNPGVVIIKAPDVERFCIPSDNSCLFSAILHNVRTFYRNAGASQGSVDSVETVRALLDSLTPMALRQVVAREVERLRNDPENTYEYIILAEAEKTIDEYLAWIQKPDSWGGMLELQVLSHYFGVQIVAADISNEDQTRSQTKFPDDDKLYDKRMFVFYDGIHYDACQSKSGPGAPITLFPTNDSISFPNMLPDRVQHEVKLVSMELHKAKKFTNVRKMGIQCQHCFQVFTGQEEAAKHGEETGHFNFQQIG